MVLIKAVHGEEQDYAMVWWQWQMKGKQTMAVQGRILMIEDLHDWQVLLMNLLGDCPYDISVAEHLQKASRMLEQHIYDLVLLDLNLQVCIEDNLDGWTLMNVLDVCRQKQGTQTIVVSAHVRPEHRRDGFNLHRIAGCFDKNHLDPQEFQELVTQAVEKACRERDKLVSR